MSPITHLLKRHALVAGILLMFLLTWLYNNTRESLLLVTLFHASFNTAGVMLPMANTASGANLGASTFVALLTAVAAVVVTLTAGPGRLSRTEPMQVQV